MLRQAMSASKEQIVIAGAGLAGALQGVFFAKQVKIYIFLLRNVHAPPCLLLATIFLLRFVLGICNSLILGV